MDSDGDAAAVFEVACAVLCEAAGAAPAVLLVVPLLPQAVAVTESAAAISGVATA
jgi:hypothetical protein